MHWRPLTSRFFLIGAVLPVLLIAIAIVVVFSGRNIESDTNSIANDAVPGTQDAQQMHMALVANFLASNMAMTAPTVEQREFWLARIASSDRNFDEAVARYRRTMLINPKYDEQLLEALLAQRLRYVEKRQNFLASLKGELPSAPSITSRLIHGELGESFNATRVIGEQVVGYNQGNITGYTTAINSQISNLRRTIIAVVVMSLLCGAYVGVGLYLRRRELLAINEQLERLALAARFAKVVIYIRNVRTDHMEWSDYIDEMMGYPAGQRVPRHITGWTELIHPEDVDRVLAVVNSSIASGHSFELEYRARRFSGDYIWLRSSGRIVEPTKGACFIYGMMRDITAARTAEQNAAVLEGQLRQSQKLEAIGTLAGGIAHDFNNILTGISGTAELLMLDLVERKAPQPEIDSTDTIIQCGRRARDLVRQILAFSRQQDAKKEACDTGGVVREVGKLIRSTTPASIEIKISVPPDLPLVMANATQMHQVVLNLCTNAVHAMNGKPGLLEVKVEPVMANADFLLLHAEIPPGRLIRISVSDTGTGMPPQVMKRVFEPFFTTKKIGEGTGLGLSVVHGIVKDHGGGIFPYSTPGQGTVFHVYLPAIEAKASVPVVDFDGIRGAGENVLLIDDEEMIGTVAANMLRRRNYNVTLANSSTRALRLFQDDPSAFDVVVTDMQMPEMSGIELVVAIRKANPDVPVVMMSGYLGNSSTTSYKDAGVNQMIMKPLTIASLTTAVSRALNRLN